MFMFLAIMLTSLPVLAVLWLITAGPVRRSERAERREPEREAALPPSRFFAAEDGRRLPPSRLPADVLLRQIERHVRLEQAAAESFLDLPSVESLHAPSVTPHVN